MGSPNPLEFCSVMWPNDRLYREQRQIALSVQDNIETYVVAANMTGKDYVAARIVLWFVLTRHPVRVITTSAKEDHLRVLWGEMGQAIQTAKYPLMYGHGGPLIVKHHELQKVFNGTVCPLSYVRGMVASNDTIAAMQGHHIARYRDEDFHTLFLSDESSSVPDEYYKMASTWFHRAFMFGNAWNCDNFFRRGVDGGDIARPNGRGYYRKLFRVTAEDSPNIRYAKAEIAKGREPSGKIIVPGVKSWEEYRRNRDTDMWDEEQKCVCLDAQFYKGRQNLMFPPAWLAHSIGLAEDLKGRPRRAEAIGVDPAEGGDDTAMVAVDKQGVIGWQSRKTPDTDEIPGAVLAFAREHGVTDFTKVLFDRGGGKQHADRLRNLGYPVRTIGFGEQIVSDPKYGKNTVAFRREMREEHYQYVNRRAQMYWEARDQVKKGFGIPREFVELHRQLGQMPVKYDSEGRRKMLQKKGERDSLEQLLGCSPDESDAFVLAIHGMMYKSTQVMAGSAI